MHAFYEDRPAEINQQFVVAKRASVEVRVNPTKDQVARLAWEAEVDRVEITQSGVVNVDGGPEAWKLNARGETTTNGIAAALQLLIDNPKQSELLRQEPERMMTFVNEALRLESPVQGLFRVVMEDTTIHNITVPKGSRIMLRYAAANRDPNKYANPDTLDICRKNSGTQVGFGAGIHHCLGASLAREEMIQTFSILLTRLNNIRYIENANSFHHHPSMILRGLSELHIQFDKSG